MKKILCILLAALLLAGCQTAKPATDTTGAPSTAPTMNTTAGNTLPSATQPSQSAPTQPSRPTDNTLTFSDAQAVRIPYQGKRTYVRYITSVDQLPDRSELRRYNAEFFAEHALLIVVETVNAGSVQLQIDRITIQGQEAQVSLKSQMQGDVSTTVMTTWMLWATVDKDLDYTWTLRSDFFPTVDQ